MHNTHNANCRGDGVKVAASAWTGIAATLLSSGRAIHSLFKLPLPIPYTSTCNVTPNSKHADYLRSVTLFIVDEASVVPVHALNAVDITLGDITRQKFFLWMEISDKCCHLFQGSLEQSLLKTTSIAHPLVSVLCCNADKKHACC